MRNKYLVMIYLMLVSTGAHAHGEDVYGPHKGFVRMPGAFHTELVSDGAHKLKVYLLDIQWKNPSVTKSSVQIIHNGKDKADCKTKDNFFICEFSKSVDLTQKGELKVSATREEQKGNEVVYKLPLKLEKSL